MSALASKRSSSSLRVRSMSPNTCLPGICDMHVAKWPTASALANDLIASERSPREHTNIADRFGIECVRSAATHEYPLPKAIVKVTQQTWKA